MELTKVVEDQKVELVVLEEKGQSMTKGIKMMNSSTEILDEILEQEKKNIFNSGISFPTKEERKNVFTTRRWIVSNYQHGHSYESKHIWRCYHCG
ncbi:hypothetical protein LIER_31560 [Lithospermum erythrorhizon]|uniref:Uncharacterized protein n=1 Tax=Lithospermum erythrorhizon TaxID=34254 RepID=A0AAV3RV47_LITER